MTVAQARIVVVDDDAAGRYIKARVLRRAGHEVQEAGDGRAALATCRDWQPDLVVLDTRLPGMSGSEICRHIKAANPQIAVLQTTAGLTTGADRAAALGGGADSFLVEPIEPEELLAVVGALLRMRRAEQGLRRINEELEDRVAHRTEELAAANRRLTLEIGERERVEEVLRHMQKMEAVGQLTCGIAHDFNNLLAVILGSIAMLRASVEGTRSYPQERLLRLLSAAETAANRGAKVTHQLLAFARRSVMTVQTVVLDEVLAGCEVVLRRALGETSEFHLHAAPGLWPCRLDPVQFESAMLNLVINARDAMPANGRLDIRTGNVTLAAPQPGLPPPGDYVCVRITDTGIGIAPDVARHIFEPFFTTKAVGHGTGLGLSQVYGFVTQSGGHVTLDSAPGAGTSFILHFSRAAAADLPAAPTGEAAVPPGTGTILIVEDHPEVRELAGMTIQDLGYRVLFAADGESALALLRGDQPIDLVFSDVVMPGGIDGFELARRAQTIREGLGTLITTGYADISHQGAMADAAVLLKPYTRSELAARLSEALARRRPGTG